MGAELLRLATFEYLISYEATFEWRGRRLLSRTVSMIVEDLLHACPHTPDPEFPFFLHVNTSPFRRCKRR